MDWATAAQFDPRLVDVGFGEGPADRVVVGGQLVNVHTGEIYPADVAIVGSRIAAVGDLGARIGSNTEVIDAAGYHLVPGMIDGHQHIEHSGLTVTGFADAVVPFGTTSVFCGLDHVFVVAGLQGVREFLDEAHGTAMKLFWGAPFRLPYTMPESDVGYTFGRQEHVESQAWPECIGVWELLPEFIAAKDSATIAGIRHATSRRVPLYGCVPNADGRMHEVMGAVAAGLRVDHEPFSVEEAREKLRLGLGLLIREGPVDSFADQLLPLIIDEPRLSRRVAFCSDGVHPADVLDGHLDRLVRRAIQLGVEPVTAIQMATINCAELYRIDDLVGVIAPGRAADILFVAQLENFRVGTVIAGGRVVAHDEAMLRPTQPPARTERLLSTFQGGAVAPAELAVTSRGEEDCVQALVMQMTEAAWVRTRREVVLPVVDGLVQCDPSADVAYVAVVERFGKTDGKPAVGFVGGFGIQSGAVASSNTPDDCNVIAIGTNPEDIALAINTVMARGGGMVAVNDGEVRSFLALPICGLCADGSAAELAAAEAALAAELASLGVTTPYSMMRLGVLCATAVPGYGITNRGVVDNVRHEYVEPVLGPA